MKDDIIRMAREAGFFPDWNWDRTNWHAAGFSGSFERLVELVRADEREACAKVCETQSARWHTDQRDVYVAQECAAAIRARGNDAA